MIAESGDQSTRKQSVHMIDKSKDEFTNKKYIFTCILSGAKVRLRSEPSICFYMLHINGAVFKIKEEGEMSEILVDMIKWQLLVI